MQGGGGRGRSERLTMEILPFVVNKYLKAGGCEFVQICANVFVDYLPLTLHNDCPNLTLALVVKGSCVFISSMKQHDKSKTLSFGQCVTTKMSKPSSNRNTK